jgi:predicted dehydrogenase
MKILIAGLGSIGRRHFRNLRTLGEENILLYRTHRATLSDDELAGFPVETDLSKALSHHPDAVIISNPTALHLDVAIPAAELGCHLLLEKPISHSLDGLERLQNAVERSGSRVLVGFQFRYHPGLRLVEKLLQGTDETYPTRIGQPLSLRAHWGEYLPGWHPWEDFRQGYAARTDLGGGVILTLSHPLDYLHWLFGSVDRLFAIHTRSNQLSNLDLQVEDTAEISLCFASGVIGSVHLNYNQRPPAHWLEVVGTEGTLRWDNLDGSVRTYNPPSQAWETWVPPVGFERNWLFLDQMRHFLQVVRGEAEPFCSLEDGLYALRLSLAALHSGDTGFAVKP